MAPHEQCDRRKSSTTCPHKATISHELVDAAIPRSEVLRLPQSSTAEEAEPSETSVPASPPMPLAFVSTGEPQSRRPFLYFYEQSTTQLCGDNDQALWKIRILQFSHALPGVEHVLMALASLHESVEVLYSTWSTEEAMPLQKLSLRQCQDAIRLLK